MIRANSTLSLLLDAGLEYSPVYLPSQNSDHLPMTLCAMAWLGAPDLLLQRTHEDYRKQLHLTRPAGAKDTDDIAVLMGRFENYSRIKLLLLAESAEHDMQTLLKKYLPDLMPSMALEAFHPMIRLAYGISAGHPGEVVNGLAYWLSVHGSDAPEVSLTGSLSLIDDLETEIDKQFERGAVRFETASFSSKIAELVSAGSYPNHRASMASCAAASLGLFQATRNFFALHLVTATQAARICGQFVNGERVNTSLSSALLAAHQVVGSPSRRAYLAASPAMDQEHVYKYAYACLSEAHHYRSETHQSDAYRKEVAAYKAIGKLPDWVNDAAVS